MGPCLARTLQIFAGLVGWVLIGTLTFLFAAQVQHLVSFKGSSNVDSGVTLPYVNYTMKGVDETVRFTTTVSDALEMVLYILLSLLYRHRVCQQRPETELPLAVPSESEGDDDDEPIHFCLYCFSGFATYTRMGDTFEIAEVTSFWAPLLALFLSRVAAFLIGAIPGMVAGVPTLSTLLVTGFVFARWRREFLRKLQGDAANGQSFCYDWMCNAFCCCFVVADDALLVDTVSGVRVDCYLNLEVVGEPVKLLQP